MNENDHRRKIIMEFLNKSKQFKKDPDFTFYRNSSIEKNKIKSSSATERSIISLPHNLCR
jgi:hypothetical protein